MRRELLLQRSKRGGGRGRRRGRLITPTWQSPLLLRHLS